MPKRKEWGATLQTVHRPTPPRKLPYVWEMHHEWDDLIDGWKKCRWCDCVVEPVVLQPRPGKFKMHWSYSHTVYNLYSGDRLVGEHFWSLSDLSNTVKCKARKVIL